MRTCILSGAKVRDKIIWAIGMLMVRFFRIASVLFRAKVLREILALFCASSTNSRLIYLGFLPRSLRCPAHCHCMRVMLTCCCVEPLTLVWLTSEKIHCGARQTTLCASPSGRPRGLMLMFSGFYTLSSGKPVHKRMLCCFSCLWTFAPRTFSLSLATEEIEMILPKTTLLSALLCIVGGTSSVNPSSRSLCANHVDLF